MSIVNAPAAQHSVVQSIQSAATASGVDFSYLLHQAKAESSLNPNAEAKTSSATGLFQFIKSTWLNTLQQHGEKHGLGEYVDAIETDFQGRLYVADPTLEKEILDLRKDPKIASLMAAEFASDNQSYLARNYTGDIGHTELYFAHFLGANGASKFLNAHQSNPNASAANLFPAAAKANKNVFYNADGSSKSLKEVYAFFDKKFSNDTQEVAQKTSLQPQEVRSRIAHDRYTPSRVIFPDYISPKIESFVQNKGFSELYFLSKINSGGFLNSNLGNSLINNLDVTLFSHRAF